MQLEDSSPIIDRYRYRRILTFFGRVIIHLILWDIVGGRIPIINSYSRQTRPDRFRQWARRYRITAVQMGGVLIKLGQFLSSRVDVLPPEITEELQGLQDEVPPEPADRIWAVLRADLGRLSARFSHIDEQPIAAASLGQAYRAVLLPSHPAADAGEPVIIKVQRPHIEEIVRTDLAALAVVARWTMRYRPIRRRADMPALMEEFAKTLWEELDYEAEADNAERFAEMYQNDQRVYIPAVYREHSTARVIVLEDVESIKITDIERMTAAGIDPKEVATCLLDTYFGQVFEAGFFHADPHPGNLFIRPRTDIPWPVEGESGGKPFWLIFVDFGMVGRVPDLTGENLRKLLISATQRNPGQLVEVFGDLGFLLPSADLERLVEAEGVFLDRMWGRNLLELARPDPQEIRELGIEFRDLLFDFPFQIPQDFIYLGRAMGMLSGLVSILDPEINPWYHIEKFAKSMVSDQQGRQLTLDALLELAKSAIAVPAQARRLLNAAESGNLKVQAVPDPSTVKHQERLERRLSQLSWSIVTAASMLSAAILYLGRKIDRGE